MKRKHYQIEYNNNKKHVTKLNKFNNSIPSTSFYNLNSLKEELKEELKQELKQELLHELRIEIKKEISEEKKIREYSYYS